MKRPIFNLSMLCFVVCHAMKQNSKIPIPKHNSQIYAWTQYIQNSNLPMTTPVQIDVKLFRCSHPGCNESFATENQCYRHKSRSCFYNPQQTYYGCYLCKACIHRNDISDHQKSDQHQQNLEKRAMQAHMCLFASLTYTDSVLWLKQHREEKKIENLFKQ